MANAEEIERRLKEMHDIVELVALEEEGRIVERLLPINITKTFFCVI